MIDKHKVFFQWPHCEPTEVVVCGSFNDWARTCHLTKGPNGFTGFIHVPWGSKITYKYIVDGNWSIHPEEPTEPDEDGNINNIYIAPSQPESNLTKPAPAESPDSTAGNLSHMVTHVADTVAAREGTSSAPDYAASGFGASPNSVVNVDPIHAEQIAIPTPLQSTVTTGTEFIVAGSSVSDGAPLPSVPAEVPSSRYYESENPVASEDPKADLTPELPEKGASDIPVPIVPVNAAKNQTVSTQGTQLVVTPPEDSIGSINTAVKMNEDVPVAVEDSMHNVKEELMTVEEPYATIVKTPAAGSICAEKVNASKIVAVPIAAAGDKASPVTSQDPASTPGELSQEVFRILETPEAITPVSDLNPSLVLVSEGKSTAATSSPTLGEKAIPQYVPIAPTAPLQKGLDSLEQTEPVSVASEVKVQSAPVLKPGQSLETSDVAEGPKIAETVPEPTTKPHAQKEPEKSVPVVSLPTGQVLVSHELQKAVETGTEPLVVSRFVEQEMRIPETEAKAETIQSEPKSLSLSTQVSAPASGILPVPAPTTGATATANTSSLMVEAVPMELVAPVTEVAPTEPKPAAEIGSSENISASSVEAAQSTPTPTMQATSPEPGPTSPISEGEVAPEPAPKTEAAPISHPDSTSTQASELVVPSNGHTERAAVLATASNPATKVFPSTASPTASSSKSGKAVPERKKKISIFGKIKHFFESDKVKKK